MIVRKNCVKFFWMTCFALMCSRLIASQSVVNAEADANVHNTQQLTSLLYEASLKGRSQEVAVLIEAGADVSGAGGVRSLAAAAHGGHRRTVQVLLRAGVDVSGAGGVQSLAAAVHDGHRPTVRVLLRAGADPNAAVPCWWVPGQGNGWTSVMMAAKDHQRFMLGDLFERGGFAPSRQYMREQDLSEYATNIVLSYAPRYPAYLGAAGKHLREACLQGTREQLPDDITIGILATAYDVPQEMHDAVKTEMDKVSFMSRLKGALSGFWS